MSQRFSDAELAAEYWRHNGDADLCSEGIRYGAYGRELESEEVENERLATLHRFATLPHGNNPEPFLAYSMDEMGNRLLGFDPPSAKTIEKLLAANRNRKP